MQADFDSGTSNQSQAPSVPGVAQRWVPRLELPPTQEARLVANRQGHFLQQWRCSEPQAPELRRVLALEVMPLERALSSAQFRFHHLSNPTQPALLPAR